MEIGALTGYFDVAQLTLYAFWIFFAGLIYYLHQENKREGYPLVPHRNDRYGQARGPVEGFPPVPKPKAFLMHDGTTIYAPRAETAQPVNGVPANGFPGAPMIPIGNPLLSGMGPGAWANRGDVPDLTFDDNLPKIVPLRAAPLFFLPPEDPDLRGYAVFGADNVQAGTAIDVWIDRSEVVIRYVEVQLALPDATHTVLFPLNYVEIQAKRRALKTGFIMGAQFAYVPVLKQPEVVTLLEEDKITAFFAGGMLYATPTRAEPIL